MKKRTKAYLALLSFAAAAGLLYLTAWQGQGPKTHWAAFPNSLVIILLAITGVLYTVAATERER